MSPLKNLILTINKGAKQMDIKIKEVLQDLSDVLEEREGQYGTFSDLATIQGNILKELKKLKDFEKLNQGVRLSIEMIIHKIVRFLNNSINHHDSLRDIAGYAILALVEIIKEEEAKNMFK